MPLAFLPITALPEIRELIDTAEHSLKADISRIKKLLADPLATLPPAIVALTLQEAKDALVLLAAHSRQLNQWQKQDISVTELTEVRRLQTIIPKIRPLIQRMIALATELDNVPKPVLRLHANNGGTEVELSGCQHCPLGRPAARWRTILRRRCCRAQRRLQVSAAMAQGLAGGRPAVSPGEGWRRP